MKILLRLYFFIFVLNISAFAQVEIRDLNGNPNLADKKPEAKIVNRATLTLPFYEDFSEFESAYPNKQRWTDNYAFVNKTLAIFPPTIGVATFDGLDENGQIYEHLSIYPSSADSLTSQYIRLDSLFYPYFRPLSAADSIYFSFFYQPGGGIGTLWEAYKRGSAPKKNDLLILEFWNATDSSWNNVWQSEGSDLESFCPLCSSDTAIQYKNFFKQVLIPITDTKFLDKNFRFRFRNLASILEPAWKSTTGQWHLDYIKIDYNRNFEDFYSPDLAFVEGPSSMLKKYVAMPSRQYDSIDLLNNFQINFSSLDIPGEGFVGEYYYEIFDSIGQLLYTSIPTNVNIHSFCDAGYNSDPNIFSQPMRYKFPFGSTDNQQFTIYHYLNPQAQTDAIWTNNNVFNDLVLNDYFAYDDASPEASFGLNYADGQFAMRFTLNKADSLSALQIYFLPSIEDLGNARFKIRVWQALNDTTPADFPIYESDFMLPEAESAGFRTFALEDKLPLSAGHFFVGFYQESDAYLNIGFDQNHNAVGAMYYFDRTEWKWYNFFYYGASMIRPVFGDNIISAVMPNIAERGRINLYPNPVKTELFISVPQDIVSSLWDSGVAEIYDIGGKLHCTLHIANCTSINVSHLNAGVYFLKIGNFVEKFVKVGK